MSRQRIHAKAKIWRVARHEATPSAPVSCLFIEFVFALILLRVILIGLFKVLRQDYVAVFSDRMHTRFLKTYHRSISGMIISGYEIQCVFD